MSDQDYNKKEMARMDLRDAMDDYVEAARAYGADDEDIASEIEDILHDLEIDTITVSAH